MSVTLANFQHKQNSTISDDKLFVSPTQSTYSRSVISPLKLTLIQSNDSPIISRNYPNAVIKHEYRWPFIASTTTANHIPYAKKSEMSRQNSASRINTGIISKTTEQANTQHTIVEQRTHPHQPHYSGLG